MLSVIKGPSTIATFSRPQAVVKGLRGVAVFRATVTPDPEHVPLMGNPSPFEAVLAVADLERVKVLPMINPSMDRGFFYTTRPAMTKINIFGYDELARGTKMADPGSRLLMAAPGNANLFTNLGYWAFLRGEGHTFGTPTSGLLHHFAERLAGSHQALTFLGSDLDKTIIQPVTLDSAEDVPSDIGIALGGPKIISGGNVRELTDTDPETGRQLFMEAMGDMQHIFKKMPDPLEIALKRMCLDETGLLFDRLGIEQTNYLSFFRGWDTNIFERPASMPDGIRDMLDGKPFAFSESIAIDRDKPRGYSIVERKAASLGEIGITDEETSVCAPRSTFNHFMACTSADGTKLMLFGTFEPDKPDNNSGRKGFPYEDTALLALEVARSCGFEIKDGIMLCNGSESLLYTPGFGLDSYDSYGAEKYEPNAWKRPLTSALLFYPRG